VWLGQIGNTTEWDETGLVASPTSIAARLSYQVQVFNR
jgi:hypothetical protein